MTSPPPVAALDDVASYAKGIETEPLICRSSSHVWSPMTSSVREVDGELHWTMDCGQCGTTRTVVYINGYIQRRRYEYPDGYKRKGLGRVDTHGRAVMRQEMFRRLLGS